MPPVEASQIVSTALTTTPTRSACVVGNAQHTASAAMTTAWLALTIDAAAVVTASQRNHLFLLFAGSIHLAKTKGGSLRYLESDTKPLPKTYRLFYPKVDKRVPGLSVY